MPVGPDYDPPNFDEARSLSTIEHIYFHIVTIVATVIGLGRASATAIMQAVTNRVLHANPNVPLSPATLAAAVVKGVVPEDIAADEARRSGMSPERFDVEVHTTGNPPGPGELVDQWRRGLIDDATLDRGIRQGYLRDEWLGFFRALRYVPLSPGQYMEASVQGHLDVGEAKHLADGLGWSDRDAQLVYDMLGNPPGIQELLDLWNRGAVTQAEVEQAIRESHYKNKYIPAILARRRYLPPPRTVTTLLTHGAISADYAQQLFAQNGLNDVDARAYVASAIHTKTASHKELAVGTVKSLYADRLLTRDQAVADLAKVGYGAPEAALVLDLADVQARQKVQNATVTHVRTLFVTHRIDEPTAQADLARLGFDAAHTADLLGLWTLERGTPTKSLSIGQLNAAYKKQIITRDIFVERATQLGYLAADAEILADIDVPPGA